MKLMFASDIHGNLQFCNKLKERYEKEEPNKLILLGDLLYNKSLLAFGRNNERQKTAGVLNDLMEYIIAVRGNCDTDLDQELLYFPIMSDYKKLILKHNNTSFLWKRLLILLKMILGWNLTKTLSLDVLNMPWIRRPN